jgi:predicted ATPase
VKALILEKTQGTPFFMEEVVQTLVEDGTLTGTAGQYQLTQHVVTLQLPSTVQAILAARIDRLASDEKALLQQLSVIGREFPLSLICQVILHPEADLYRLLASLQRKELSLQVWRFRRWSTSSSMHSRRRWHTARYCRAQALTRTYRPRIGSVIRHDAPDHYSDLAHHYRRSTSTEKAIEYLQLAGQQAVQRSGTEAITHLTTAEFLNALPDTPERAQHELTLHLTLGPALMNIRGLCGSRSGPLTPGR